MKNQSVSDFVANAMEAVLNSQEHKSLFETQYKQAQASAKCEKCGSMHDKDLCMADDNDARKKKMKEDVEDESSASDMNDARKHKKDDEDSSYADDNDARKKKKVEEDEDDSSSANDGLEPSVAFDVAIDSLLTASAALDSVGLGRGSALTLKIASLVVEAKKKDKKDKKDSDSQMAKDKAAKEKAKAKEKAAKEKEKKDTQMAKDKEKAAKEKEKERLAKEKEKEKAAKEKAKNKK